MDSRVDVDVETSKGLNWLLLATLGVLNYFDYVFTKGLMIHQGYEVEVNPIMYNLVVYFDTPDALLWVKIGALTIFGLAVFWFRSHHRLTNKGIYRILVVLNAIFVAVVLWGYYLNTLQDDFLRINSMLKTLYSAGV